MGRLTTDNPRTKVEKVMNFAYAENMRVKLRYPNGNEDIDLCDYIERQRGELGFSCGVTSEDVMEGACNECDCVLAILNIVSIQAAELRERLKRYEDAEFDEAPTIEQYGTWIPCSERLPGKYELCLITQRIGNQLVRKTALYIIGEWKYNGRILRHDSVIAWMPLPKPHKAGDQNE